MKFRGFESEGSLNHVLLVVLLQNRWFDAICISAPLGPLEVVPASAVDSEILFSYSIHLGKDL